MISFISHTTSNINTNRLSKLNQLDKNKKKLLSLSEVLRKQGETFITLICFFPILITPSQSSFSTLPPFKSLFSTSHFLPPLSSLPPTALLSNFPSPQLSLPPSHCLSLFPSPSLFLLPSFSLPRLFLFIRMSPLSHKSIQAPSSNSLSIAFLPLYFFSFFVFLELPTYASSFLCLLLFITTLCS
jgi:hypothetical protein